MDKKIALSFKSMTGGYKTKTVLKNISFDIEKGSFTAIAGPNGSGKSTILKYLIRELKTSDDTIFVCGCDINSFKQMELAKRICFVNQTHTDNPDFTVNELVQLGRFCYGNEEDIESKSINAMKTVGIEDLKNCVLSEISGGELQLAMLARAICQDSDIILLDEPVNSLDPKHQIMLLKLLKELSDKGKTVVCILHDLNLVINFCDSCILIKEGKVFASGKTGEVITGKNIELVYGTKVSEISQADGRVLLTFCYNL